MLSNKRGVIKVSNDLYTKDWSSIYPIFKDFKPIRITFNYFSDGCWNIYGISDKFDALDDGVMSPYYTFTISKNGEVTFKRVG